MVNNHNSDGLSSTYFLASQAQRPDALQTSSLPLSVLTTHHMMSSGYTSADLDWTLDLPDPKAKLLNFTSLSGLHPSPGPRGWGPLERSGVQNHDTGRKTRLVN